MFWFIIFIESDTVHLHVLTNKRTDSLKIDDYSLFWWEIAESTREYTSPKWHVSDCVTNIPMFFFSLYPHIFFHWLLTNSMPLMRTNEISSFKKIQENKKKKSEWETKYKYMQKRNYVAFETLLRHWKINQRCLHHQTKTIILLHFVSNIPTTWQSMYQ